MESKMTIIAFSLWSIATVYSSTVIADVWKDYNPPLPEPKVEVVDETPDWVASIFNSYFISAWTRTERVKVSRPEFFLTPFITRYHEEAR